MQTHKNALTHQYTGYEHSTKFKSKSFYNKSKKRNSVLGKKFLCPMWLSVLYNIIGCCVKNFETVRISTKLFSSVFCSKLFRTSLPFFVINLPQRGSSDFEWNWLLAFNFQSSAVKLKIDRFWHTHGSESISRMVSTKKLFDLKLINRNVFEGIRVTSVNTTKTNGNCLLNIRNWMDVVNMYDQRNKRSN